jgi:hypothetical protein
VEQTVEMEILRIVAMAEVARRALFVRVNQDVKLMIV